MKIRLLIFLFILHGSLGFAQRKENRNNPIHTFPTYQEVVKHFLVNYNHDEQKALAFSRRPQGWVITFSEWVGQEFKETYSSTYWNSKTKEYIKQKLPVSEIEQLEIMESLLSPQSLSAFQIHPYYGYKGWDKDIVMTLGNSKSLSDTLLYGIARAYSNMAQGYLRPQYEYHFQEYKPAPYGEIEAQRVDSFIYCVNNSIRLFQELAKRSPYFMTVIGNISVKAANESMNAYIGLKSVKDKRATLYLKDISYPDFYLITARNFLSNCDSNAILFTSGDIDTYPLLYVQEKENFRQDVHVINLSLLNTSWYAEMVIDQYSKTNHPIPHSLLPKDYTDKLDFAYVLDPESEPEDQNYQAISRVISYLASTDPETKLEVQHNLYPYIPIPYLMQAVDFKKVITQKTVPPEWVDRIEDPIKWKIKNNYILRNQILMLDIIAENNWEYSIYWTSGISNESLIGLASYTRFDGLVYKLVPVRFRNIPNNMTGSIFSPVLFEVLMNRFNLDKIKQIEHANDEGLYFLVSQYRFAFARLISSLIEEDEKAKAAEAAHKCINAFPANIYPYYYIDLLFVEGIYKAGLTDEADRICIDILDYRSKQLTIWLSVPANHPDVNAILQKTEDVQTLLTTMVEMLYAYERDELAKTVEKAVEKLKH